MRIRLGDDTDFFARPLDDIEALLEGCCSTLGRFRVNSEDLDGDFAIFEGLEMFG
jgi:hypothetical protein